MSCSVGRYPDSSFENIGCYFKQYMQHLYETSQKLDLTQLEAAADIVVEAMTKRRIVYSCGNGGSASIASHLKCDFLKGAATGTDLQPRIEALSDPIALITAIGNDIGYDEIFSFQLRYLLEPGDVVLAVSSSGSSPNVVKALQLAKSKGNKSILFSGFDGGAGSKIADVTVYYPFANYGIVEDLHQSTMHIMAQYIRLRHLPEDVIQRVKF